VRTNVRLIAATHRDLESLVAENRFRLDLYYRLGVVTIHLPPLRDRGGDISLLAQLYVQRFSRELGRQVSNIAPEAMERLCAHTWPGNIRELQNVLKQAVLRAQGDTLLPAFLPPLSARESARPQVSLHGPRRAVSGTFDVESFIRERVETPDSADLYEATRQYVDRFLFKLVLCRTQGNYSAAAQLLGISRQTLRRRLPTLGISVAHSVELDDDSSS